jgi:hypothetical protein
MLQNGATSNEKLGTQHRVWVAFSLRGVSIFYFSVAHVRVFRKMSFDGFLHRFPRKTGKASVPQKRCFETLHFRMQSCRKCIAFQIREESKYVKRCILTNTTFFSFCRTLRNKSEHTASQKYSGIDEIQSFFVAPNGLEDFFFIFVSGTLRLSKKNP